MKLHSIFISALLITGFSAHAMEKTSTPVDLKAQLQAHVLASDATNFKDSWHNYQATAQAQEVRAMQSVLINLAAQLRTHKDQERTTKFNGTWGRCLAGACAISSGAVTFVFYGAFICDIFNGIFKNRAPSWLELTVPIAAIYLSHYAIKNINYACFAGTKRLTKEINALNEILAYLNLQTPELIDTETEIIK